MQNLHCQYRGERHRENDTPCLSHASCYTGSDCTIAVMGEGFDDEKHTYSDIGAQIATEVAVNRIRAFVKNTEKRLLKGMPITQLDITAKTDNETDKHLCDLFEKLIAAITVTWKKRVEEHWRSIHQEREDSIPDTASYSCMLSVYVQTKNYWFFCQLGTGKCLIFTSDGQWHEPMPESFEISTLDHPRAIERFRICMSGDDDKPLAAVLTNDGFNKAYPTPEDLANYHAEMLKLMLKNGLDTASQQLKDDLPIISQRGNQDDAAIAMTFDLNELKYAVGNIINRQIETEKKKANHQEVRITQLTDTDSRTPRQQQDLTATRDRLEVVSDRIKYLIKEYEHMTLRTYQNRPDYSEALEKATQTLATTTST